MPGPMSSRSLMRGRMQETVSVQRVLVVDREGNECGVKKGPITIFVRHRADCPCADDDLYKGCRCSKYLRSSYGDQQSRQAAKTRAWSVTEENGTRSRHGFGPPIPLAPLHFRDDDRNA